MYSVNKMPPQAITEKMCDVVWAFLTMLFVVCAGDIGKFLIYVTKATSVEQPFLF